MWINNNTHKPLRKGYYKTLVDWDGLGNLKEVGKELFNGADWCRYESHYQYVCFWQATDEDYEIIANKLEINYETR